MSNNIIDVDTGKPWPGREGVRVEEEDKRIREKIGQKIVNYDFYG